MNADKTGWNLENTYLNLPKIFYTEMKANPVKAPKLILINKPLVEVIGLNIEELKGEEGLNILSGNRAPKGSYILAQAYAGHQFGHFTKLGDGRAMLIGEQITPTRERLDIQLKGSGRTAYSRGGDGRATLSSMLREYIISESMYHLGIPTTRSLAVVSTGEKIIRETRLPGAILTRLAKSHIRVGTFEYAARYGSIEDLKALANYTITRHYPELNLEENPYLSLLKKLIEVQAPLISKWQLVGFIHGVMNTDNMTISGETIDYGPCAFMDIYDPKTVFSSIDRYGRYAYGNQPSIGKWNLARFAETLLPLIHDNMEEATKLAEEALKDFENIYNRYWLKGMRSKLGIFNKEVEDKILIEELLNMMEEYKEDYTNTFIALSFDNLEKIKLFKSEEFRTWYTKWNERLGRQEESKDLSRDLMKKSNPSVIPRNHLVEEALSAAQRDGNYRPFHELLDILSNPYKHGGLPDKYIKAPEVSSTAYKTYCGT